MYGIFTNINPQNHPNVGKYTIHGIYMGYKTIENPILIAFQSGFHRVSTGFPSGFNRVSLVFIGLSRVAEQVLKFQSVETGKTNITGYQRDHDTVWQTLTIVTIHAISCNFLQFSNQLWHTQTCQVQDHSIAIPLYSEQSINGSSNGPVSFRC